MIDWLKDFRSSRYAAMLAARIKAVPLKQPVRLMEVCGGHTIAIFRYGLRDLLPDQIRLLSGPGCPVCVTDNSYIDKAVAICRQPDTLVCTFGDLMRVPGSESSLGREKAAGRQVRVCLSAVEAVQLAADLPRQQVVFLGIGFETTAPTIAAAIKQARQRGIENFSVLSALKTMPAALAALAGSSDCDVQGFICPGHVTVITGTAIYNRLAREFGIPCVVTGFEPLDMLQAILMLSLQIAESRAEVEIQYTRSVTPAGNPVARRLMEEVLQPADVAWRGLGIIPGSGLQLRPAFAAYDADRLYPVQLPPVKSTAGCLCGLIMRGVKTPPECSLFARQCTPTAPSGACMVSSEGTCAAYFKYYRGKHATT